MSGSWNIGSVTAIGVGLGAALAASTGPIGYLLGLVASLGLFAFVREVRRHRQPRR